MTRAQRGDESRESDRAETPKTGGDDVGRPAKAAYETAEAALPGRDARTRIAILQHVSRLLGF
jgi:hypothetical protein